MGRIVVVVGPLYVEFVTALMQPATATRHPVLYPERRDKGWERRLGGSAAKVAAFWTKYSKDGDKVILVTRVARPWSEGDACQVYNDRPFVDDARWLNEELARERDFELKGVQVNAIESDRSVDYTFHLQGRDPGWPIQTIWGGAAHELCWKDVCDTLRSDVPKLLKEHPDQKVTEVLVILCGVGRTSILEQIVAQPNTPLALPPLDAGIETRLVIDFGRAELRAMVSAKGGATKVERMQKFLAQADLVFADEPTVSDLDLLEPDRLPQQSLVVRHTLSGTWRVYRRREPGKAKRSQEALERCSLAPANGLHRPERFAKVVSAWQWSHRAPPAEQRQNDWKQYRPLDRYRDLTDITKDEKLLAQLKYIAASVLSGQITKLVIHGETGTGKEIIARWLLRVLAQRKETDVKRLPFVVISPGGSESMAQAELFGHVEGAFTGAIRTTRGAFERADGGLLLLDDLQEIGHQVQVLMLRALEYGDIAKVGDQRVNTLSDANSELDVFLVCTVNRPPDELIRDGDLLRDLYYRLTRDGPYLELSPLRDRRPDALLAADKMWQHLTASDDDPEPTLPDNLQEAILKGRLAGNYRTVHSIVRQQYMITQLVKDKMHSKELFELLTNRLNQMINEDAPQRDGDRKADPPSAARKVISPCHRWIVENRSNLQQEWRQDDSSHELNTLSDGLEWIRFAALKYYELPTSDRNARLMKQHLLDLLGELCSSGSAFDKAMKVAKNENQWSQIGTGAGSTYTPLPLSAGPS